MAQLLGSGVSLLHDPDRRATCVADDPAVRERPLGLDREERQRGPPLAVARDERGEDLRREERSVAGNDENVAVETLERRPGGGDGIAVPRGSAWIASSAPSGRMATSSSSAPGEQTTTSRSGSAPCAASTAQRTSGRPSSG